MILTKAAYTGGSFVSLAAGVAAPEIVPQTFLAEMMSAIGIGHLPGPVFIAGLAFAVAGAFIALARTVPEDRADKWWTLLTAILMGTAAAIIQSWAGDAAHRSIATMPPQVFMFLAGLASRSLADWLRFGNPIATAKTIADAAISLIAGNRK